MRTEDAIDATGVAITAKVTQAGAGTTLLSWLLSSEGGMAFGICIGVLGLLVNFYYQHRRDKREHAAHLMAEREHKKRMDRLATKPGGL